MISILVAQDSHTDWRMEDISYRVITFEPGLFHYTSCLRIVNVKVAVKLLAICNAIHLISLIYTDIFYTGYILTISSRLTLEVKFLVCVSLNVITDINMMSLYKYHFY
jgi:hypothetical protein